jgi:hypothetical protein
MTLRCGGGPPPSGADFSARRRWPAGPVDPAIRKSKLDQSAALESRQCHSQILAVLTKGWGRLAPINPRSSFFEKRSEHGGWRPLARPLQDSEEVGVRRGWSFGLAGLICRSTHALQHGRGAHPQNRRRPRRASRRSPLATRRAGGARLNGGLLLLSGPADGGNAVGDPGGRAAAGGARRCAGRRRALARKGGRVLPQAGGRPATVAPKPPWPPRAYRVRTHGHRVGLRHPPPWWRRHHHVGPNSKRGAPHAPHPHPQPPAPCKA